MSIADRITQAARVFAQPMDRDMFRALTMPAGDERSMRRAVLPEWYYAAPYGQPRGVDIAELRELAKTPFIHMCVKTIVDDFATTESDIVPLDPHKFNQAHIDELKAFLDKPNENKETEADLKRQWAYDVLTVDSGVMVKIFSEDSYEDQSKAGGMKTAERHYVTKGAHKDDLKDTAEIALTDIDKAYRPLKPPGKRKLKEVYVRDGSTFLADGDYTGFVHRYFQYSFKIPFRVPEIFDRAEIVYSMMSPRSYSFYGWSPIQSLEDVVRALKEAVIYSLTGFTERGVPEGIISILGMSKMELDRLQAYWQKDMKGKYHRLAVLGGEKKAEFTPISVTSKDMEMIAGEQWFMRLVMAIYNVDIPTLSLKSEAPRAGTWALIRRERQKAILPLLQLWEHEWNSEVISEFGYTDVKYIHKTYDLEEDQAKREMDRADVQSGVMTINEVRQVNRGMDPVAWGNEPFDMGINALRTGGLPMTQFPKSLEKNKPTLDKFKEVIARAV